MRTPPIRKYHPQNVVSLNMHRLLTHPASTNLPEKSARGLYRKFKKLLLLCVPRLAVSAFADNKKTEFDSGGTFSWI